MRPHWSTVSTSVTPNTGRTWTCLEWVWMRVTKVVRGTEQLSCERQAETGGVVQPGDWRHLGAAFEYLKGTCKKGGEGLLQGHELRRAGLDGYMEIVLY